MSSQARVTSIEAVHAFRGSLREFEEQLRDVIVNLELEMRRAMQWIDAERPAYWRSQYQRASQAVTEARNNLERCELSAATDERRSCMVEQKALEKAKRRLRTTEDKLRAVKRWQMEMHHEAADLETQLARLGHTLDDDVSRGIAALGRMTAALDRYAGPSSTAAGSTSPAGAEAAAGTAPGELPPPDQDSADPSSPETQAGSGPAARPPDSTGEPS